MFEQKRIADAKRLLDSTDSGGLSEKEAGRRLLTYGPNELLEQGKKPLWERILSQFMDPLIYVLAAAGIVSALLGEIGDAFIVLAVVLLNGTVGLIQEGRAIRALDALKEMTRLKALVRRDGIVREIDAGQLAPGDLVLLDAGRQVPADLRLILSENLKIEEAALTGESEPVRKDAGFTADRELPTGDCKNLAFMSTNVTAGRGEGLVIATGMETEIGKIARLIKEAPKEATPLQKRLGDLGTVLSVLAVILCGALFVAAVWQKRDVGEMFITAVSLAVAAVPEGLPAVVTIVLALSVSRMVRVNTIVRRLPSVETLGAVTVVCSDKTGTLTKNQMTVVEWSSKEPKELWKAFSLCNDGALEMGQRIGDPTELALLEYGSGWLAEERGGTGKRKKSCEKDREAGKKAVLAELKEAFPRIAEQPFDSERKRMTTVHRRKGAGGTMETVSYTKGAPDVVVNRCSRYLSGGQIKPLTERKRKAILSEAAGYSARALRVLAAAMEMGDGRREEGLIFLGLAAMTDPPRPEVPHALELFKKAGVRTVMITGDHKETAFAIAKELGIAETPSQCMTGAEIDQAGETELAKKVRETNVFARVTSNHKVRIVRALKGNGNIVAMTGDGVNDAPSLKAADVGIAMGKGGTDVAKQAADLVLTDDNFATIEKAIEEGRGIYENIKKSVIFLLSSNFGEIMTMFTAIVCSLPSPLKASHILWINLITDSLPALALGVDKNDGEALMEEEPRRPGESLFSRGGLSCTCFYGLLIGIISLTAFLRVPVRLLWEAGLPMNLENLAYVLQNEAVLTRCQTYAFTVLGLSQIFHAVGMRDVSRSVFRKNPLENGLMVLAAALGILLQLAVTEIPFLVAAFQTVKLSGAEWRELLFLAAAPMAAHELLVFLQGITKVFNH